MGKKKNKIIREIIKDLPKSPSPRTSRANRGIYQTGPWSDSLKTTNVKVDGAGGPGTDVLPIMRRVKDPEDLKRGLGEKVKQSVESITKKGR